MIRRVLIAALVVAACLGLGLAVRRIVVGPRAGVPQLVIYNGLSRDFTALPADHAGPRVLGCYDLGRWALRVGTRGGYLAILQTETREIQLFSLARLGDLARGRRPCDGIAGRPDRRVRLHAGELPYRGRFHGDQLFVTYSGENRVEVYDWVAGTPPNVRWRRDVRREGPESLGFSDTLIDGDTLAVAASGFFCSGRDCPEGWLRSPRLLFFDAAASAAPRGEIAPANLNTVTLYRHPGTGAIYAINAGSLAGGYSSLQRLAPDRTLGAELRLPRNAAAAHAVALGPGLFAVLQFGGEHLFLVDARRDVLLRIVRFDGTAFVDVPLQTSSLPDRSGADFQDLVPVPGSATRFHLIDSKGERVLEVAVDAAKSRIDLVRAHALARPTAFRTSPSWGVWLGAR